MNAAVIETQCPGPNDLAAFAEGSLGAKEYQAVEAHLAECAECRDMVLTVAEMDSEAMAQPVPMRRSMWVPAAILAAAAGIAGVVFLTPAGDPVMRWKNARALTKAVAMLDERPVAGRLSFETEYKPNKRMRGAGDGEDDDAIGGAEAMLAAANSAKLADKSPTVSNLHAAGVALLTTDEYKLDGITHLEKALKKHTSRFEVDAAIGAATDAKLLNDLAAGYEQTGNLDRARAAIERAWALDKSSLAIAWTRAEILRTKDGWNDYLKLDSTSEWGAEASRNAADY